MMWKWSRSWTITTVGLRPSSSIVALCPCTGHKKRLWHGQNRRFSCAHATSVSNPEGVCVRVCVCVCARAQGFAWCSFRLHKTRRRDATLVFSFIALATGATFNT